MDPAAGAPVLPPSKNPLHRIGQPIVAAQGDGVADYVLRDGQVSAFFARQGLALALTNRRLGVGCGLHWSVAGGAATTPRGGSPLPARVHRFVGDRRGWSTDQPAYGEIVYDEVAPGIDVAFESRPHGIKYTLHAAPGADPSSFRFEWHGAREIRVVDGGSALEILTDVGSVREDGLFCYQETEAGRRQVEARYRLEGPDRYAIEVGDYDPSLPLVVDPTIGWSTFVGGQLGSDPADDNDDGNSLTVDAAGNVYVTGLTDTVNFPVTAGAFRTLFSGSREAYVAKISANGSTLLWSTYLGGEGIDTGSKILLDGAGNVVVCGQSQSADFPVTPGAYDITHNGSGDVFVVKLNPAGSALVWSTFVGGSGLDSGLAMAFDSGGNICIAGLTTSTNFPTTAGVFQPAPAGGNDGFVAKLSADGTALQWATYVGGLSADSVTDLALDGSGNPIIVGTTDSTNFPTAAGFDSTYGGTGDAFVSKLSSTGVTLLWSSFLGGNNSESTPKVALDGSANVYVVGSTTSVDFPATAGAFSTALAGARDVFATRIAASGGSVAWATFLGGTGNDTGLAIVMDASGNVVLAGSTASTNFPTTAGAYDVAILGTSDGFVTKLNSAGTALVWSTFLGGSTTDAINAIAVDGSGNLAVAGDTFSPGMATVGAFDTTRDGDDVFVATLAGAGNSLMWYGYLGGAQGPGDDPAYAMALDGSGNVYIAGTTRSTDFPVVGPFSAALSSEQDIFVSKINAGGGSLAWSTYLGGTGDGEIPRAIAVDGSGNVYLTGETNSSDFPTTLGVFQFANSGTNAFVTKINAAGSTLAWSSYLGATGLIADRGYAIAVDAAGAVYVAGETGGTGFPVTPGAFSLVYGGGGDAFVSKVSPDGTALVWSTYLGGSQADIARGIAVDGSLNVVVTGSTDSNSFPVSGGFDLAFGGTTDCFITKINSTGTALVWSTFLGGSANDTPHALALDGAGNACVSGLTVSFDFPTSGGFDPSKNGGTFDAFVAKIASTGSVLTWSSYLGGSGDETGRAIGVDASGNVYVTGETTSPNFPVLGAIDSTLGGTQDAFVTKINAQGSTIGWSTYLGGARAEFGRALAADSTGNVYVSGETRSSDFPIVGALDAILGPTSDAFVVRLSRDLIGPSVAITAPATDPSSTGSSPLSATGTASDNLSVVRVTWSNATTGGSGTAAGTASWSASIPLQEGPNSISVTAVDSDGNTAADTATVLLDSTDPVVTIQSPPATPHHTPASSVAFSGTAGDAVGVTQVTWSNAATGANGTASGTSAWSATIPVMAGSNLITISAVDGVGNVGTAQFIVVSDNVAPTVSISIPTVDPAIVSGSFVSLSGTSGDNVGATVSWSNAATGGSGAATGTTSWSASVPLQAGSNAITVTATDSAGNTAADTITVIRDSVAPSVSITQPTSNPTLLTGTTPVSLGGTASDNVALAQVTWANQESGAGGTATGTDTWSASIPLIVGTNTLVVTATDAAGRTATDSIVVTYDAAPPLVAVVSPPPPTASTTASPVTISGTAGDDVLVVGVAWSNTTTGAAGAAAGTTAWSASVPLQTGSNSIDFTATDGFGRTTTVSLTVFLDNVAPVVAITSPTTDLQTSSASTPIVLGGTASDDVTVASVTWQNLTTSASGPAAGTTSWSASVPLQDGENLLLITATDGAGNTATDTVLVTFGSSPTLTITTAPGFVSTTALQMIAGTAADSDGVSLVSWINQSSGASGVALGTTAWSADVPLLPGANTITIIVWDALGNHASQDISGTSSPVDAVAPAVQIDVPTSAASLTVGTTPLALGGTATDAVGVIAVSWRNRTSGASGTAAGTGPWTASIPLVGGANDVQVTAVDAAGNSGSDTIQVTLTPAADAVDPLILISTPTAGGTASVASSPAAVGGAASDNEAVSVVRWSNAATGAAGVAAGTTAWSASIPLRAGLNLINVTAEDPAGNVASDQLVIDFAPPGGDSVVPVVEVRRPSADGGWLTSSAVADLGGIAADNQSVVTVLWMNEATGAGGAAEGIGAWSVPSVVLAEGTNRMTVTAIDGSGNETSEVLVVFYAPATGGGGGGSGGGCGLLGLEGLVPLAVFAFLGRARGGRGRARSLPRDGGRG